MNREQLEKVAKRKGLVKWHPSGKVEMIRICLGKKNRRNKGFILARDLVTKKEHVVWPKDEYMCLELTRKTKRSSKVTSEQKESR